MQLSPSRRSRLSDFLLFVSLCSGALDVGGTLYQIMVVTPEWSRDLPGSVRTFFADGKWFAAETRFWTHPATDWGMFPLFLALWVSWPYPQRRNWLIACVGVIIPILIMTFRWYVPEGVYPLMRDAGAGMTDEEITAMAQSWMLQDRVRFVAFLLAFGAGVQAYASPPIAPVS